MRVTPTIPWRSIVRRSEKQLPSWRNVLRLGVDRDRIQPLPRLAVPRPQRRPERRTEHDQRPASRGAFQSHRQTIHPRDDVASLALQRYGAARVADLDGNRPGVVDVRDAACVGPRPQFDWWKDFDLQRAAQHGAMSLELRFTSEARARLEDHASAD